jgi:CheY-like chemotaxis protein
LQRKIPLVEQLLSRLEEKKLFKIPELARFLGITPQAVHLRLISGRVHAAKRTSKAGNYLILRREVVRILKKEGREVAGIWTRLRKKILVIDENEPIRKLMRATFRDPELRLDVRTAATAEDGLVLAATFLPHVIVVDYALEEGRLQGDQAVALIRRARAFKSVRVIGMASEPDADEKMLKAGAHLLLVKPFGLEELRRAIYSQAFAKSRIRYAGDRLSGVVSDGPDAERAQRRPLPPRKPLPVPCRSCGSLISSFVATEGIHSIACPKCGSSTSIEVYMDEGSWRLRTSAAPPV